VKKGHFNPPPKVDSAIIAVGNINRDSFLDITREQLFTLLHLGFGQKRKQLLGNLSQTYARDTISSVFTDLDIPLDVRAEDVPPNTWFKILCQL
jgi:16S rRNA A1518/A1519 N6-dimethyltransferase RsmA/KsgA/DIM1 with predicted DNA glycosylase/AP lyase activity